MEDNFAPAEPPSRIEVLQETARQFLKERDAEEEWTILDDHQAITLAIPDYMMASEGNTWKQRILAVNKDGEMLLVINDHSYHGKPTGADLRVVGRDTFLEEWNSYKNRARASHDIERARMVAVEAERFRQTLEEVLEDDILPKQTITFDAPPLRFSIMRKFWELMGRI